jgi:hypothetical protein
MQENTKPENPEDSDPLDKEQKSSGAEGSALPENSAPSLPEPDPQFEEQEGEVLPREERKKSGAGTLFLLLVFILAGSGGYLYFNNLIPPEILNLVFPKPVTPESPVLVAQVPPTPLPIEPLELEIAKGPNPATPASESPDMIFPAIQISGNEVDPNSEVQEVEEAEKISPEHSLDLIKNKEPEETQEKKVTPEFSVTPKQEVEEIAPRIEEPAAPDPIESTPSITKRNKSTQAYLDFIESSAQKLSQLIKKYFYLGWNFFKTKSD